MTPEMAALLTQIKMLASLLVIGFASQRLRLMKDGAINELSTLLTHLILPCMLLTLIGGSGDRSDLITILPYVLCCIVLCIINVTLGYGSAKLTGLTSPTKNAHVMVAAFGNGGFIGVPMITAMFGSEAGLWAAAYLIVESSMYWIFGPLIADCSDGPKKISFRRLVTPLTIAIFLGLCSLVLSLPVKDFVFWTTLESVGGCAKYLAALYIGMDLGRKGLKKMFSRWQLLVGCALKLIAFPILGYLIFGKTGLITGQALTIFVLLYATPTGMAVPILAKEGKADDDYATAGTMLATILCLGTMPLVLWLISLF